MCLKIKSLLKIVCVVIVFCVFLFIEGKFNLIFPKSEKSSMSALRILSAQFEVFGTVQGE